VFQSLRTWLNERQHDWYCREILTTDPIKTSGDGPILFSMMGTRVLRPYLVAAKSLRMRLGVGHFKILSDGTLTAEDRATLKYHLDDPEIFDISKIERGPCPAGGCWERLITVLTLAQTNYVIQFDSDVICLHKPTEVASAVAANVDFTMLGEGEASISGIVSAASMKDWPHRVSDHIQVRSEKLLVTLPDSDTLRYVRGCAGFAGYAHMPSRLEQLFAFSSHMEKQLGVDWARWGTEQVASNFMIANHPSPRLLSYDHYLNHEGWTRPISDPYYDGSAHIMHFIGSFRYKAGRYRKLSRKVIADYKCFQS
jgi:hypothetical protein